jgi:putative hydrolase of the HAD superfamily
MSDITAIIFDCFGVIITDALEQLVTKAEQQDPQLRNQIVDLIHASNRGYTDPVASSTEIAELLGMTYEQYRAAIQEGEAKDPEVIAWIKALRKQYKTAMLSNIGRGSMARRFTQAELSELFDIVVTSGDLGIAKPDTEIYEHTARQLGVEPGECVFIDDREGHTQGADAAGMQTILFSNLNQAQADLKKILAK